MLIIITITNNVHATAAVGRQASAAWKNGTPTRGATTLVEPLR